MKAIDVTYWLINKLLCVLRTSNLPLQLLGLDGFLVCGAIDVFFVVELLLKYHIRKARLLFGFVIAYLLSVCKKRYVDFFWWDENKSKVVKSPVPF